MGKSRRRTPISGTCVCRSERTWKELWHRRYRRAVNAAVRADEDVMPHVREISDVWSFGKDGKTYWPKAYLVVGPERFRKLMRK